MGPIDPAEYDFELPEANIAQHPPERRADSRLLCLDRRTGATEDGAFPDLLRRLPEGAALVLNNTRVIPARLRARRQTGGAVEVLLTTPLEGASRWLAWVKPAGRLRPGERLAAGPDLGIRAIERQAESWIVELEGEGDLLAQLDRVGEMPLPPYIRRPVGGLGEDRSRYQTVYARVPGAVAAPTAGLHFTPELLDRLEARGVEVHYVTLHVGPGTFAPLREEALLTRRLHAERYEVAPETWERLRALKAQGRPIVAVGTTSVRTLESVAASGGRLSGETTLFITPGFEFAMVDGLVTNFHLPRSSLLMLVAALAGRDQILRAYQRAIDRGYRFYSYGDAMFIL